MYLNETKSRGWGLEAEGGKEQPGREQFGGGAGACRPKMESLLTPRQVAKMLGVSVDWVQAHATRKQPRIDHIRAGKLIHFTPQQVADFVRRQAVIYGQ
jgi:hypothetical protein